jgi:hypothetical protein
VISLDYYGSGETTDDGSVLSLNGHSALRNAKWADVRLGHFLALPQRTIEVWIAPTSRQFGRREHSRSAKAQGRDQPQRCTGMRSSRFSNCWKNCARAASSSWAKPRGARCRNAKSFGTRTYKPTSLRMVRWFGPRRWFIPARGVACRGRRMPKRSHNSRRSLFLRGVETTLSQRAARPRRRTD